MLRPSFERIDEVAFADFEANGFGRSYQKITRPLLVKGAVKHWPAWQNWSFENLATICDAKPNPNPIVARFQTGLTEQGTTRPALHQPVAPYLRSLSEAASTQGEAGKTLVALEQLLATKPAERFELDWSRLQFEPNRTYLQQWDMLAALPELRKDFPMKRLWPGARLTWEYVFIGPSNTLSGLHFDFPNNWFCQVRGTKEFILFTGNQSPHLSESNKYDWGATLSGVDIARLDEQPEIAERFGKARGIYARVEAGDALYIPRRTWHAVVALTPSISIGIFGLTPSEVVLGGGKATAKDWLHKAHLYRWGNCTCHAAEPASNLL